jgi:hypothetical protein
MMNRSEHREMSFMMARIEEMALNSVYDKLQSRWHDATHPAPNEELPSGPFWHGWVEAWDDAIEAARLEIYAYVEELQAKLGGL